MKKILLLSILLTSLNLMAASKNLSKEKCMENNASECYLYALPLLRGDNSKIQDIREEGLEFMRKSCVLGYAKACDIMGENYYKDKRYMAAKPYLEKSCERGIKSACEKIGVIYRDARDVNQNDVKAREFFEKACSLKSADACYNVAIIYRGGFGVAKNRIKEKDFYDKSCKYGLKVGCDRFIDLDNEDKGIQIGIWSKIKSWFN